MGDAVTGINRADSAIGECSRCCANFWWFATSAAIVAAASHYRIGTATASRLSAVLTAFTAFAGQAAYPPPRESCVRGADRAAVDKRFRLSWSSRTAPGPAAQASVPDRPGAMPKLRRPAQDHRCHRGGTGDKSGSSGTWGCKPGHRLGRRRAEIFSRRLDRGPAPRAAGRGCA